jgi:hypothetical protein
MQEIFTTYFINTTSYLPYLFLLIPILLYFPALALFPRLILRPFEISCVPIISILLINTTGFLLRLCGFYHHLPVVIATIAFSIIAIIRLFYLMRHEKIVWSKPQRDLFLISIAMMLPMVALGGISAFSIDDALVSWNFWATHYFTGQQLAGTGGYPQMFPFFLSYAYQLLGTIEYQGPVKALLVILPFTLINTVLFYNDKITAKYFFIILFVIFIGIFPPLLDPHMYRFYVKGYADPMLAAAVIVSAAFLLKYCASPKSTLYLWIAVIGGIVASLSKQPGFMWVLWGFPLLLIVKMWQDRQFIGQEIFALIIVAIPVSVWLFSGGSHFYQNTGVITSSLGEKNHIQMSAAILSKTLWHSIIVYWIDKPSLLLLYVMGLVAAWESPIKKTLYLGFILPGTLLWFIFGAYEIRLGLHLLVLCALLVGSNDRVFNKLPQKIQTIMTLDNHRLTVKIFCVIGALLFIFLSIRQQNIQHHGTQGNVYPLNATKTNVYWIFSTGAPYITASIVENPKALLWIPTQFISAIFYSRNPMIVPPQDSNTAAIVDNILKTSPDYLFTDGDFKSPASQALEKIATRCPSLFKEISLGQPMYHYRLFQFDKSARHSCLL